MAQHYAYAAALNALTPPRHIITTISYASFTSADYATAVPALTAPASGQFYRFQNTTSWSLSGHRRFRESITQGRLALSISAALSRHYATEYAMIFLA